MSDQIMIEFFGRVDYKKSTTGAEATEEECEFSGDVKPRRLGHEVLGVSRTASLEEVPAGAESVPRIPSSSSWSSKSDAFPHVSDLWTPRLQY